MQAGYDSVWGTLKTLYTAWLDFISLLEFLPHSAKKPAMIVAYNEGDT